MEANDHIDMFVDIFGFLEYNKGKLVCIYKAKVCLKCDSPESRSLGEGSGV